MLALSSRTASNSAKNNQFNKTVLKFCLTIFAKIFPRIKIHHRYKKTLLFQINIQQSAYKGSPMTVLVPSFLFFSSFHSKHLKLSKFERFERLFRELPFPLFFFQSSQSNLTCDEYRRFIAVMFSFVGSLFGELFFFLISATAEGNSIQCQLYS